ncbi:hypothetical protein [Nocardia neocaledoniensis]|uniref:hypothetical protein n=1 Tax=Nocardia neocaledoniensis TaxID=236511 RepID=UPI002453A93F|nr:hypothetical protein [Nocardia neocaledoniensis]
MTETLVADPSQIAGLSNSVKEIGHDGNQIAIYVRQHCRIDSGNLGGELLESMIEPLQAVGESFALRMAGHAARMSATGGELNRAAWMYHDQDRQTYDALNAASTNLDGSPVASSSDRENGGITRSYDSAVTFGKPAAIDLDPPAAGAAELADVIADATGILGDANNAFKEATRAGGGEINILENILKPVKANWNELRRLGEAHKKAGNAMEACGTNLDSGVKAVGPHWDGKAALAFESWAAQQSAAMKWEGPLGRLISDVMNVAAEKIKQLVIQVCEDIKRTVIEYVTISSVKDLCKTIVKRIPVLGWTLEVLDLCKKLYDIFSAIMKVVDKIKELRDQIVEFMRLLANPALVITEKVNEKLSPITSKMEDAARAAALASDAAAVAQYNDTLNRPTDGYEIGSGRAPWEDSV